MEHLHDAHACLQVYHVHEFRVARAPQVISALHNLRSLRLSSRAFQMRSERTLDVVNSTQSHGHTLGTSTLFLVKQSRLSAVDSSECDKYHSRLQVASVRGAVLIDN